MLKPTIRIIMSGNTPVVVEPDTGLITPLTKLGLRLIYMLSVNGLSKTKELLSSVASEDDFYRLYGILMSL